MGSTARFGLRYPDLTDAPNGPDQFEALAEDADGWLCRAYRCTSATRPSGVPNDFIIRESDTGNLLIWTGSAWSSISGSSGGGGGGGGTTTPASTISSTFAATSAQSIPSGVDTIVAFGVEQVANAAVTRSTSGAGHKFTLAQTRLWIITATVRFSQDPVGGRTFELQTGSGATLAKSSGPQDTNAPWTANLSVVRQLAAGSVVQIIAHHNSSSSVSLEPASGNWVHIDIAGV